jgi:uncharacterized protein
MSVSGLPVPSHQWSVRYALAALVAATASAVLIVALLSLMGLPVPGKGATLILEAAFLASLIPLYRSGRLRGAALGLRRAPGARSVCLVVLALLSYAVVSELWNSLIQSPQFYIRVSGLMRHDAIVIVFTGFVAAVGAPVVEEVYFRGFIYRSLRNEHGVSSSSVIAGALFGLWHFQYPLLVRPELAFFGVVAALLYEYTGSLLPGIAMHSFVDASGFDIELTGNDRMVGAVFGGLAVLLLVRSLLRAFRRRGRSSVIHRADTAVRGSPNRSAS